MFVYIIPGPLLLSHRLICNERLSSICLLLFCQRNVIVDVQTLIQKSKEVKPYVNRVLHQIQHRRITKLKQALPSWYYSSFSLNSLFFCSIILVLIGLPLFNPHLPSTSYWDKVKLSVFGLSCWSLMETHPELLNQALSKLNSSLMGLEGHLLESSLWLEAFVLRGNTPILSRSRDPTCSLVGATAIDFRIQRSSVWWSCCVTGIGTWSGQCGCTVNQGSGRAFFMTFTESRHKGQAYLVVLYY